MAARIAYWNPDDPAFWAREGERVARRNLLLTLPCLVLSFAIWMVWSVVVVALPHVGFRFTANQLFWLAALPGLAGGTLRLLFSFMVPMFGGRTWTTLSTLALVVPALALALAVQDPGNSYPILLLAAALAGIGGGNFSSSMANVSFFYPGRAKGAALGWAAGIGNAGVALAQFVVPLVVGIALFGAGGGQAWVEEGRATHVWLQNAGYVWVPLILVAALAAWVGMDDLDTVRASMADQAIVFVRRDTWLLSWLYLGTFGSFIGFSAGFPLLAETTFPTVDATWCAFAGPLLAALARPFGGWLADRRDGARVALAAFVAMALGVAVLLVAANAGYGLFVSVSLLLFVASGVGNGAVFQIIPRAFIASRARALCGADPARAVREGTLEGAAALGLASGIGAFGGFFIPKAYGTAIALTGDAHAALYAFFVFYLSCAALTWVFYARRQRTRPSGTLQSRIAADVR